MKQKSESLVIPEHVAIIMDGNGRWAKKKGLPRSFGHKEGAKVFRNLVKYISNRGVKHLTVYAFSTENWKRPLDEVNALMVLFRQNLIDLLYDFADENVVVKFIGDRSAFSPKLRELIDENEESSKNRTGMVLNIAMNYGGRDEILRAVKQLCNEAKDGTVDPEKLTDEDISKRLYTGGQPDPDLIIRTGGEMRLSNFLLYQCAYSEFYSTDTLWPDFDGEEFEKAILAFNGRNRRFGGV